jgi:hypothetical protein
MLSDICIFKNRIFRGEKQMFRSQWRKPSLLVLTTLLSSFAVAAHADVVRIVSVNGIYDPNHAESLSVQPGDMVTLSADLLDPNNNYSAEGQPIEDFNWSADDSQSDACTGGANVDCLSTSNFELTDYGVNFYVPYTMGQQITISVNSSLDGGTGADGFDSIVLTNAAYGQELPPVQVITSADQYTASTSGDTRFFRLSFFL